MSEQILLAAIVLCVVAYLVHNQINKITNKIDSIDKPKLYADFSAIIQAKIREIRLDIDTFKTSLNAKYILNDENELTSSLELLSDLIRQLVFLETMSGKNQNPQQAESKLFEVLNELDNFVSKKITNGEQLAGEIKDELFEKYQKLQEI